ncbi:MAG: ribonuclease HI [Spirochaetes bacterium]|nr:ribonuclease HI [Spirochaetota bacterium]
MEKKYYAVAKGRKPGIYKKWYDAKLQVDGYSGAIYKGFPKYDLAREWINRYRGSNKKVIQPGVMSVENIEEVTTSVDGKIIIYADGSCKNNPGPGGYGIIQIANGEEKEITGGYRYTTNNRMELMAVIVALENIDNKDFPVIIYTDSQYVVNSINKGWAKKWKANNWIKKDGNPALNRDLWEKLLLILNNLDVSFYWIMGHAGNPINEKCDKLAMMAARKSELLEDVGYVG